MQLYLKNPLGLTNMFGFGKCEALIIIIIMPFKYIKRKMRSNDKATIEKYVKISIQYNVNFL